MPNNRKEEKYISLLEAARIYGCTQKHMALMAREKKLRAIKLGRNWLTTIDWLKEYNKAVEENNKKRQIKKAPIKRVIFTPQVKSVFRKAIAASLISLLVFTFISTAYIAAKEGSLSLAPFEQIINKLNNLDFQSSNLASIRAFNFVRPLYEKYLASVFDNLKPIYQPVYSKVIKPIAIDISNTVRTVIRGYNKTKQDVFAFIDNLFTKTGNFVINFISNTSRGIVKGPSSFGKFVVNVFQDLPRSLKKFFTLEPFAFGFPTPDISEQSFITIKDLYKKLSKLRKELGEIERGEIIIPEPGDIIQHITVVKKIEGIDQETLDELKTSILAEVDAKISAIEITDFESMTFHHDSLWANIGSFSTALGTGGAFSAYGPVTLGSGSEEVVINATNWDVDDSGNITAGDISLATLTASGDITVSGNITGSGTLAISGQATFTGAPSGTTVSEGSVYINPSTASSSYTLFGIAVGGTEKLRLDAEGDLTIAGSLYGASTSFDAIDATTLSLDKIPTITSDPVLLMQPTNVSGSWATGSATFLGINASSSFSGNFADFRINNTSKFFIDEIGNLGVAGVGQFGGISTVSYSRFGIGTTSHGLSNSQDLLISGSLEVASDSWFGSNVSISQNLEVDGAIYGDLVGTITVTGFNQGSVIFAGPGGELSEDNVNFFWDDTSNRLGIGDTSPDAKFDVAGSGIFDNELIVGGALQVGGTTSLSYSRFGIGTSSHGLSETQDVMISGKLEVASDSWFGSNASVSGKFEVLGDITLGDADTDLLVVNADIASNLIPNDSTRYVGDTNSRWAYGYFDELNVTSMSAEGTDISGTRAETFTINSDNETNDTENAWLTFERGPTFTNASLKWDSGNDRFDMNFPLIVSKSLDVTGTFRADYVGIGTAPGSPYLLNVAGDVYFQEETFLGTTSTYFDTSGNLEMGGGTISDATDEVDIDDSLAVRDYLQVGGTSATTFSRFGTADSDYGLSAANDLLISGNLEVDSSTWFDSFVSISSNFEIGSDKFKVSGSTGNTTIAGNLTLSGIFTADTAASHSFAGDLAVGDDLDVSGTLTINTLSGILKASSGTISGLANLDDINDVVITSVADNELLAYDSGGNWINQTASEAGLEPTVSWADLTIGGSPLTITGGTNAVAVATAITFNYDSTIFSIDGNDLTIASASFWELTYDWKVASESFYDEAYQQRGSQIAGTNLTWDGSELDWSATESDLETILGIDFGTNKTATNEYFLIGDGTDWESTASSSVLTLLELDNVLKADGSVDLTSDWTIANNNITLTAGTLTANHLAGTTASVSGKFEVLGNTTLGDTATDLLVVNADIASNLIPNDGTRYVGDANNRWAYGYFDELNVTSMSAEGVAISGTTHETFTINSDAADDEDAWLAFERGSLTNASLKWDSANDKFDMNFPLTVQGYIYGQDELIIANQAQFGGTSTVSYSRFGIGNTGHGLSASNDLLISGDLEVDGRAWFDSTVSVSGNFEITGNTTIAGLTTLNGGLTTAAGQSLTLNGNLLAFPADTTYLQVSGNQLTFASDYQTGAGYDSRFVNVAGDTMTGALILNSVNELIVGGALQIGGLTSASYSRFGTTGATYTSAISTSDDLMISGDLEVDGQAWFDSTASVSGNFDVGGVISGDGSGLFGVSADPAGSDGQLQYNDNGVTGGATSFYWNDSTNRVGIGDSTPETTFEVVGTASVSGAFYAADSTIQFGNFTNCNLDTNGSGNLVCGTDADTTYSAGGTLLNLTGTVFSVNEGTLTNGNICKYNSTGTKIECILTDSSINWDAAYDWKVASESFYDEAYNQRGSVIAGTNLTWDGSELDVDDPFTVTQLNFTNASGSGTFEMGSDKFKIVGSSGDTTIAGTLDPANVAAFTLTGQQTLGGTYYINNSGDAYFRYVGIGTAPGSTYRLDVSADSYLQGTTFLGETDTYFDTSGNLQMGGGTIADSSDEVDVDDSLAVNSYLQVGDNSATTYSRFGLTTDTSNHSLSGATSVLVAGNLEINGTLYTDGGIVGNGTFDCVDCIDWDDISDSMTLDANLTVASASYSTNWKGNFYFTEGNVGIGTTAPSQALELGTNKWLSFEGTVDDAYETVIQVTNPTADRTITLQNVTGTVYVSSGTDVTLADGGTNASLTASTGGIVYSGASALAILSGTATANKVLMSGASAAPVWSTPTYPNAATTGNILKADGTNIVLSTDFPTAVTIGGAYVYRVSGTDVAISDGGTGQSTALAGFNALSPLTTRGDLLTRDASNNARLGIGTTGKYLRSDGTDPSWQTIAAGDLPGSFSGFANPTATIGLTVVNGSATTAMRSDAAPPLSQAIIPTWTGTHTFSGAIDANGNVSIADTNIAFDGATTTFTTTGAFTLTPGGAVTLGDGGDTMYINSNDWDISTTGVMTGISGITTNGGYTQSGTTANTFTGTSTFSNATYSALFTGGNVGIGTTTPGAKLDINGVAKSTNSYPTASSGYLTTTDYTQSRLQNLVTNGSGLMGNNYNFSTFTFDQIETHGGAGSFKHVGAYANKNSDEYIPVDGEKFYRLALWGKSGDTGGGNYNPANHQYVGIIPYDIDTLAITPFFYSKVSGSTDTTLAADLNPNDTTVTLTDATGWYNGATGHSRNFVWYGYTNSFGYTYPDYTYSRYSSSNYSGNGSSGAWIEGGISGNVITLRVPWAGPAISSGSAVRNNKSGGTYKYITCGNTIVPNEWTRYEGYIGSWDVNGTMATNLFPYGTGFIRLLFLNNYTGGTSPTNIIRWSDIWFSEMSSRNIEVATTTRQGVVSTGTQSFAGNKTFTGDVYIGDFYFRDTGNGTNQLSMFDPTNDEFLVFDELSSPDIWEQTLTYQFEQGTFYQITIDKEKDHLLLAKDINGNYYSNGTFTSSIHNYSDLGGIGDFIQFRTGTALPSATKITAHVQVSDDNFSTIKDLITLELTNDLQTLDISSLVNAKSVRVKLDFQTQDTSVTPHLVFFEVWADIIPAAQEETSPPAVDETSSSSTNEIISDAIYIDSFGNVGIGTTSLSYKFTVAGTTSISGDLHVGGVLYASVEDLGFANDFVITEATDEPALSFLNLEQEEIMRINDQGVLKTKELCLGETCINEEDLKSFLGLKIASSSGTIEDNITITYSTNPIEFLGDLINGLEKLGVTIKNGVITAVRIVADKITAKEIFVEGNVEVQGDIETKGFLKQVVTIKKNEADAVNDTNIAEETELERYVGRLPIAEDEVGFVSYSRQTVKPEISASGTGQLQDGEARINFDPRFVALLQTTIYKVIVTPTSETKMGLYVAEKTLDGFLVRGWPEENNITFDWLVIASLGERANEEPIVEPSTETTASSSEPIVPAPEETVASESEPGSEQPTDIEGCTDDAAINYNLDATVDDGTCEYPLVEEITGCTDPEATNYNPDVTTDDASCEYPAPEPVCGDGECNSDETCDTCPRDCGECPPTEETTI